MSSQEWRPLSERKPACDEVWIHRDLVQELLRTGAEIGSYKVLDGPDATARIIGVHLEGSMVILRYDRPITAPVLQSVHVAPPTT